MYKPFLFILFFFCSCVNIDENKVIDTSLEMEVMRQILVERHLLLAQITSFQYPDSLSNSIVDSLFNAVCVKNGSSLGEFNQSWKYYNSQGINELIKVYDLVIADLKVLELKDQ
mgnify:CR=1 FL=1|jgi:hypothetical protein